MQGRAGKWRTRRLCSSEMLAYWMLEMLVCCRTLLLALFRWMGLGCSPCAHAYVVSYTTTLCYITPR